MHFLYTAYCNNCLCKEYCNIFFCTYFFVKIFFLCYRHKKGWLSEKNWIIQFLAGWAAVFEVCWSFFLYNTRTWLFFTSHNWYIHGEAGGKWRRHGELLGTGGHKLTVSSEIDPFSPYWTRTYHPQITLSSRSVSMLEFWNNLWRLGTE